MLPVVLFVICHFIFSGAAAEVGGGRVGNTDVVVWQDGDGIFHAENRGGIVFSGEHIDHAIQAAMNSLTPGRTVKEKVLVVSSGTITRTAEAGPVEALMIPSYTILDIPATLKVEIDEKASAGERLNKRVQIKARNARHIDIPNINIVGDIGWGIKLESVSNVRIGHAYMNVTGWSPIRIDAEGTAGRSRDIQIHSAYIEGASGHAFETRGVDRLQVGQIMAKHMTGCAVLLNETNDATINSISGYNPNSTSNYATFRTTRHDHGRISVNQIVSLHAPRGIHIHAQSGEIIVSNIYIDGARGNGIRLSSSPNTILTNGIIKNTRGTAIEVFTFDDDPIPARTADGVTISHMRIYDDRPEGQRTQTRGIVFRGQNGTIVNNDLRNAGTQANMIVDSPTTFVRDNLGAGIAEGTVTLQSGSHPAARIEGVSPHRDVNFDLRARAVGAPEASFSWNHYFEYNGSTSHWDLVIEWRTDPGVNMELEYNIDQPLANLGRSGR